MEKDIVDGSIGQVGHYDVEFKDNKLTGMVDFASNGVSGKLAISIDAIVIADALKKKISGTVDDVIIDIIMKALSA